MAQVKKLTGGGPVDDEKKAVVTPENQSDTPPAETKPPMKYWMQDNVKIEYTEAVKKKLAEQAMNGNVAAQSILATLDADGYNNNLVINRSKNGVTYNNLNINFQNDRTRKQFEKGDKWRFRNFTGTQERDNIIQDFLDLKLDNPVQASDETQTPDPIVIGAQNRRFSYDENGAYNVYDKNNATYMKELEYLRDYFKLGTEKGREVADKAYQLPESIDKDALWKIYTEQGIDLDAFIKRIQQEDVPDNDPIMVFLDGLFDGKLAAGSDEYRANEQQIKLTEAQTEAWKPWATAGFNQNDFTYDQTSGQYKIKNMFSEFDPNKNYWFNDSFLRLHPNYAHLHGKVYFGGKWYDSSVLTNSAHEVYKELNSPKYNYYNKNRQGDYTGANNIMETYWGDQFRSAYDPSYLGDLYNNDFLHLVETNYRTDDSAYNGEKIPEGYQVIRIKDSRDKDEQGLGRKDKYTIVDVYGNYVGQIGNSSASRVEHGIPIYDADKFTGLYDESTPLSHQQLSRYQRITDDENNYFYNAYRLPDITTPSGDKMSEAWKVRNNDGSWVVHARFSTLIGGDENNMYMNMPEQLYNAFVQNKQLWADLSDPMKSRHLIKPITDMIKNNKINKDTEQLLTKYFGYERAVMLCNYFKNAKKQPVPKHKTGGILKAQQGTVTHAGFKDNAIPDKSVQLAQKIQGYHDPAIIRHNGEGITWDDLNSRDKWELRYIGADLAGTLAGYIPVYGDVASVGAGLVTNTARAFHIDGPREGFWGALGNWLVSTGLDVFALVPGLGDAANTSKALKDLAKLCTNNPRMIGFIATGFQSAGLAAASDSFMKLVNGEDLTTEDAMSLANGFISALGLGTRGARRFGDARLASALDAKRASSETVPHAKTVNFAGQEAKKIELTDEDIKSITSKTGKDNIDNEFRRVLTTGHGLTPEQAAQLHYDDFNLIYQSRRFGSDKISARQPKPAKSTVNYFFSKDLRPDLNENAALLKDVDIKSNGLWRPANRLVKRSEYVTLPAGYEIDHGTWGKESRIIQSKNQPSTGSNPNAQANSSTRPQTADSQATTPARTTGNVDLDVKLKERYLGELGNYKKDASKEDVEKHIKSFIDLVSNDSRFAKMMQTSAKKEFQDKFDQIMQQFKLDKSTFDHAKIGLNRKGGIIKAQSGAGVLSDKFFKKLKLDPITGIEAGKFLTTNATNKQILGLEEQASDAMRLGKRDYMQNTDQRLILPHHDLLRPQVNAARLNTRMQMQNYSDPRVGAAMFNATEGHILQSQTDTNRNMSDTITNTINQKIDRDQKIRMMNNEIGFQNNQIDAASAAAKINARISNKLRFSENFDKFTNYLQHRINQSQMAGAQADYNKMRLGLMKSEFAAKNPGADTSAYDAMMNWYDSDEYKNYIRHGISLKQGGKVTSTERMLKESSKATEKAIEKLNDDTMKLILKALS